MSFVLWIMTLFAAAIGTLLATFVSTEIIENTELVSAIFWFLIAFFTFTFAKRIEEVDWFGVISLQFLITWAFTTVGVLIGDIVWELIDAGSVSIEADAFLETFLISLPLTLGPTATASLGLRSEE